MQAVDVFRMLGGRRVGHEWLCPCPLPTHGKGRGDRNPSLAVRDGRRGLVVHCHAGCDPRSVLVALRADDLCGCRQAARTPSHLYRASEPPTVSTIELARRLWSEGRDPRGTLAETYLLNRGLDIPPDLASRVLRYHEAIPWTDETRRRISVPGLLAAFTTIEPPLDDVVTGVLRIRLNADGSRNDRRMLGSIRGCAIKLDADENAVRGLMVCEGLETGMSARMLGLRPVWVLGAVSRLVAFRPFGGIETLTIIRETDDGGQSIAASEQCAALWHAAGLEVRFLTPRFGGDMDDVRAALMRCRS